jgi:hypothetical protein
MLYRLVKKVVLLCLDVYVISTMYGLQLYSCSHVEVCTKIFSGAQTPQFVKEVQHSKELLCLHHWGMTIPQ